MYGACVYCNSRTMKSQSLLCHNWECEVYGWLAGFADKRGLTPCMHFYSFLVNLGGLVGLAD